MSKQGDSGVLNLNQLLTDTQLGMKKTGDVFASELQKIRTGRANTGLLSPVMVSCYGQEQPLIQVASVTVDDARTLKVTPFDKTQIPAIEKAIQTAGLGLMPLNQGGGFLRIPLPILTEERRKELIKLTKKMGEESKVAIRNIRHHSIQVLDRGAEAITKDEVVAIKDKIQKITDVAVLDIDKQLKDKEKELLTV